MGMTRRERWDHDHITDSMKLALIILLDDGRVMLCAKPRSWIGVSGRRVTIQTVEALYNRALVRIIVESRHHKTHTLRLTQLGEFAAQGVQLSLKSGSFVSGRAPHGISERTACFIAEITS